MSECRGVLYSFFAYIVLLIVAALLYFFWFKKKFENILSFRYFLTVIINGSLWFWATCAVASQTFCEDEWFENTSYNNRFAMGGICFLLAIATLADTYFSPEVGYFYNMKSQEDMVEYFEKLKHTRPYLRFHIVCFYQQWVTAFGRTAFGQQKGYWKEVVTFRGQSDYPYESYQDLSEYPDIPMSFQDNPVLAYHIDNITGPGDDFTVQDVERYKQKLIEGCRGMQGLGNIKCDSESNIPEALSKITCIKADDKPFWFNFYFYIFSILFSINGIVRIKFQLLSRPRSLIIKKMMFADPSKAVEFNLQGTGTIANVRSGEPDTTMIISHVDPRPIPHALLNPMNIPQMQLGPYTIIDMTSAQPIGFPHGQPGGYTHTQIGGNPYPQQGSSYPHGQPGGYPHTQIGGNPYPQQGSSYPHGQPGGYPHTQLGGYPYIQEGGDYPAAQPPTPPPAYPGPPDEGSGYPNDHSDYKEPLNK